MIAFESQLKPSSSGVVRDVLSSLADILFFFKQKTAYVVRISDWSSDVCSSDLAATALPDARGRLLNINQDGVKMEAVAVAHPMMLLARPAQKAAAWDSLKLFNRGR